MSQSPPMPDLQTKLVESITLLQHALDTAVGAMQKATPEIVDLVLLTQRIDGFSNLFFAFIGLILGIILIITACFLGKRTDWDCGPNFKSLGCVFGFLFGIPTFLTGGWTFFNVWNWAAIFYPKAAIAHNILLKAGLL